ASHEGTHHHDGPVARTNTNRAVDRAVASARLIWLCAWYRPAATSPSVRTDGAAVCYRDVPTADHNHAVQAIRWIFHRSLGWGEHWVGRSGQSPGQCRGATDRARAGAAAQGRAVSGALVACWIRSRIKDRIGCRRRAISDPALDILRRVHRGAEIDLVGNGG